MTKNESKEIELRIPPFVDRQLENYPILPGEDRKELKSIFRSLAYDADEPACTAAECTLVFRTATIVFCIQRYERMRIKVIRHHHHAAVLALLSRAKPPMGASPAPAILQYNLKNQALEYFNIEQEKQSILNTITCAGYEPDAVETEAYRLAMPELASFDREINNQNRQLVAIFKELDRRYARRATAIKKEATNIIARTRGDKKAA